MPKYYSIKKFEISDDNLKSKYQDYLREVLLGNLPAPALSYEKFIDFEPMFEEVIMKCLECKFQETIEHSHMLFSMSITGTPFPIETCPVCGMTAFMPLDIYRKIKGYK